MKGTLAIFGATGRTGQELVAAALARDWRVRALCRPGSRPSTSDPRLAVVEGELTNDAALAQAVAGTQAACCVFGPRPPFTDLFCAPATRAIVAALRGARVPRIICQTGAMIGPYPGNRTAPFELMARTFARRAPAAAEDRRQQEQAVRESGLAWTLLKPPRLADGPARNRVLAGQDVRVGLLSSIRRADLAQFILGELDTPRFLGQAIFLKG